MLVFVVHTVHSSYSVLDEGQHDSVDPSDYGKAVAIHSGAHPAIGDRNVGFLISSHPSLRDI